MGSSRGNKYGVLSVAILPASCEERSPPLVVSSNSSSNNSSRGDRNNNNSNRKRTGNSSRIQPPTCSLTEKRKAKRHPQRLPCVALGSNGHITMATEDLLQPGHVVKERWKVVRNCTSITQPTLCY